MSALTPGLYRATVRGVADTIVIICDDGWGRTGDLVNGRSYKGFEHLPQHITDARPLIVIDTNPITAAAVAQILRVNGYAGIGDQILDQTKPTRIPEPGLWGVVEAGLAGYTSRRKFVGIDIPRVWLWVALNGSSSARYDWEDLIDPTLIREGIS